MQLVALPEVWSSTPEPSRDDGAKQEEGGDMTFARLAGALLAAGCTMLVLASVGAPQARSSSGCDGVNPGFNFELGIANTCNYATTLSGSSVSGVPSPTPPPTRPRSSVTRTRPRAQAGASSDRRIRAGPTPSAFSEPRHKHPRIRVRRRLRVQQQHDRERLRGVGQPRREVGTAAGVLGQTNSTADNAIGVEGTLPRRRPAPARRLCAGSTTAPASTGSACGARTRAQAGACTAPARRARAWSASRRPAWPATSPATCR